MVILQQQLLTWNNFTVILEGLLPQQFLIVLLTVKDNLSTNLFTRGEAEAHTTF